MSEPHHLTARAEELRAHFDAAFAEPPPEAAPAQVDLLAIRCGEHGFALRLAEVISVHTERKVVATPSPSPQLLGLAGVRGLVFPVYDLGALLGQAPSPAPRWLALVRVRAPFALGFDSFEQHLRVPTDDVVTASQDAPVAHPFGGGSVRTASGPRPLIDLPALFEAVMGRRRAAPGGREDPR
jgi:purine-binding chemotaxis protein CheW